MEFENAEEEICRAFGLNFEFCCIFVFLGLHYDNAFIMLGGASLYDSFEVNTDSPA